MLTNPTRLRVEAHSNIFMLRIEGEKSRDFYLSAETEKELHEWILALQKVLGADMDGEEVHIRKYFHYDT